MEVVLFFVFVFVVTCLSPLSVARPTDPDHPLKHYVISRLVETRYLVSSCPQLSDYILSWLLIGSSIGFLVYKEHCRIRIWLISPALGYIWESVFTYFASFDCSSQCSLLLVSIFKISEKKSFNAANIRASLSSVTKLINWAALRASLVLGLPSAFFNWAALGACPV